MNPLHLIRHKAGRTLRSVSDATGIAPEELLRYEEPGYPLEALPLGTAAAIAKALRVHAEDLLFQPLPYWFRPVLLPDRYPLWRPCMRTS